MEIITITKENLEKEHICCAISNKEDIQVTSKKIMDSRQALSVYFAASCTRKLVYRSSGVHCDTVQVDVRSNLKLP